MTRDCWHKDGKGKTIPRRGQAHCASNSESPYTSDEEHNQDSSHSGYSSNEDAFLAFLASHSPIDVPSSTWILDTGATCHLTSSEYYLSNYTLLDKPFDIRFGNNGVQSAVGVGTAMIELPDGNIVAIDRVYHVPHIAKNLLSVTKITSEGTVVEFRNTHCLIKHKLPTGM